MENFIKESKGVVLFLTHLSSIFIKTNMGFDYLLIMVRIGIRIIELYFNI